jgi:hypothetical protein
VRTLGLILPLLTLCLAAGAAQAQQTPRQLIARLGLDTRADDSRQWTRQREAEAQVARQLRALGQDRPGDAGLVETDALGRTPLMEAAVNGYADVVESLLTDSRVRAGIDDTDRFGATAWALSQFARPVTLIACHPQMYTRERLPLLRPYTQRVGYFRDGASTRFERIGQQLLGAGARPDPAAAKAAWLAQCPGAEAGLRQRLAASDDLSQLLWAHTYERLEQFKQDMANTPARLTSAPLPRPVWPSNEAGDSWQQRWPRAWPARAQAQPGIDPQAVVICSRMAKPTMPHITWRGDAVFRLVAEFQAGAVTVADIRLVSGRMEPRVEALLQATLIHMLASYECAGDHIIEQELRFKVE